MQADGAAAKPLPALGPAGTDEYDAVVVGSGPNGLTAACLLAERLESVLLIEGKPTLGGGTRTEELTLPGFRHDVCSAIHPMARISPVFQRLDLEGAGLEWIEPPVAAAHPLDDGTASYLVRDLEETASGLGADGPAYRKLLAPLVRNWPKLEKDLLAPVSPLPSSPFGMARFGLSAVRSAASLVRRHFRTEPARALFAGMAAHSIVPLDQPGTAAIGLVLSAVGHRVGWPLPRGGSSEITRALAERFREFGGEVRTDWWLTTHDALPCVLRRDTAPAHESESRATRRVHREAAPLPPGAWRLQDRLCAERTDPLDGRALPSSGHRPRRWDVRRGSAFRARGVWEGKHSERPFVLVAQQSLFDPTRAPEGHHTGWVYCHVPHGSSVDMTAAIEAQIERFAPGFRDVVLHRATRSAVEMERYNPNYIGGDITGGANTLRQVIARPTLGLSPYATPDPRVYLCSASTPPGGGVHGMCGYHAAEAALRRGLHRSA